jgi:hypothetical protein
VFRSWIIFYKSIGLPHGVVIVIRFDYVKIVAKAVSILPFVIPVEMHFVSHCAFSSFTKMKREPGPPPLHSPYATEKRHASWGFTKRL